MENLQIFVYIMIFVIIQSIYFKFDSIFTTLLFLIDSNFYMYSKLNLGYAPLSVGNNCDIKYSNELYNRIIVIIQKHMDLTNKVLIETPCSSRKSIYILPKTKSLKKFICISPYKSNVNFVHKSIQNKSSYIYGQIHQLSKLNLPKDINCCLTVEASRIGYTYDKLSKHISTILNKGSLWVISDLFKSNDIKTIQNSIKLNKFRIKDVISITDNVIESLNCDSDNKKNYLSTMPIIKEQLQNLFFLKNSNNYNKLITQESEYLIMIFEKI